MTPDEQALVISLVRAHVVNHPDNLSWVSPYTKVRWSVTGRQCVAEYVVGHWRRKALCKRVPDVLMCVCKQQDLTMPPRIPKM